MSWPVWGLTYGHHDASAVIIEKGEIVYAKRAQEYSGIPFDKDLPHNMIVDMIVRHGTPSHVYLHENKHRDLWRKIKSGDWSSISWKHPYNPGNRLVMGNHHLSHAATGYYTSGFDDAVVIVADAIGELESLAVYKATDRKLDTTPLFVLKYPHSLGLFYSHHVAMVGMQPNRDEAIFMKMTYDRSSGYHPLVNGFTIEGINFKTTKNFHRYPTIQNIPQTEKVKIASATQQVLENYMSGLAKHFRHISSNLVFTGGVAYNSQLHRLIATGYNGFYVPSHPGDTGSSLGAILQHTHQHIKLNGKLFK
ncbi:hypothetical protein EBT25_14440 [bacterium]|nr:hypothetical protein [bacterium]